MQGNGVIDRQFWKNRKVFITGHSGFKGTWLSLWLYQLGAKVTGYSLKPGTVPSMYEICRMEDKVQSVYGDIRNAGLLRKTLADSAPEIVIHMAAQPLLRESYRNPIETYSVNIMGTVHLMDAVRECGSVKAIVNVTTDKCYENKEWEWAYRENDTLGGFDPYSSSKACSELITSAYRNSYFNPVLYKEHGVAVASARAGNVVGGGDWAKERLVPDIINALRENRRVHIRNPNAIRPWQHVLEPLSGYLVLAQKLHESGTDFGEGWNFGPDDADVRSVQWVVSNLCSRWGSPDSFEISSDSEEFHESYYLKLDSSKSKSRLGWRPQWTLDEAIDRILEWVIPYENSKDKDMVTITLDQIEEYEHMMGKGTGR